MANRLGDRTESMSTVINPCRRCNETPIMQVEGATKSTATRIWIEHHCRHMLGETFRSNVYSTSNHAIDDWHRYNSDDKALDPVPIPIRLHCPICRSLHVDQGEFATKPHHTHACQRCGHVWRPAIVPTVGVQFLPGFKDAS